MSNYVLSNKAVEDLTNIWNYSFYAWSELQADKYYSLLIDCFQELADGQSKGKKFSEINDQILGKLIGQHIVFYRRLSKSKVEIVRILHSSMDLKNRINEDSEM